MIYGTRGSLVITHHGSLVLKCRDVIKDTKFYPQSDPSYMQTYMKLHIVFYRLIAMATITFSKKICSY